MSAASMQHRSRWWALRMARLVQWAIALALAAGVQSCSGSGAAEGRVVVAAAIPSTDHQRAPAGSALPTPLQVLVLVDGKPAAGQPVSWSPSSGRMTITSGITDASGVASGQWILGPEPGELAAYATVPGARGSPVQFTAIADAPMPPSAGPAPGATRSAP